jgi:spermidine synthase
VPRSEKYLPFILVLFAGSGCSALIYEVVWYQLLQLAIGSTTVSLGILLATFMGGLCIGSLGLPRLRWADQHPLRVYALLEVGIGICGLLVLFGMPLVSRVYFAGAASGLAGMLLRGLVAAVCMLVPTALMGASLPAIVRWVESTPEGVSWWGLLYGGNTVGAVLGCLLTGFYLLRIYDTAVATYAAVAINGIVAALSFWLASRAPARARAEGTADIEAAPVSGSLWPVYVTIGLSGACALGAEVVWTRLLGMLLGATVYVFAIILAVFLVGLALGSGGASLMLPKLRPRAALGWCQILLTAGIAWTAYMIADSLPYWPIDTMLTRSPWQLFQLDMARCLWAVLPPALLWGASMPLALAAAARPGEDSGRVVGGVYAANTLGAIVGALSISLVLVPWIGTQNSQRLLLIVSALSALFVLAPLARSSKSTATVLVLSMIAAVFLARGVDAVPGALIAYGRRMPVYATSSQIIYTAEGRNSSVAIGRWNDGAIEIDVNGHVEATTEPYDMKLQRMVGHLPLLLHPHPKSVLGIGFGAGVSAGTFTRYPTIQKITICEIEPLIPPISTKYFGQQNYEVFKNPKTHIQYDDARHYLMTTREKFDVIASDPLDVFVKGTAALYSKEYFDAVKRHLNPGGIFTLYVPLYESDVRTVKSELATFFNAFPYATVWANNQNGQGYDMVFMGQMEPLKINVDEIQKRLERPDYAPVAASLQDILVSSAGSLFSTYTGGNSDLGQWTKGAPINYDRDLRLMYLAGWGINSAMADRIYRQMLSYRRLNQNPFTGSPQTLQSLMDSIEYVSNGGQ